MGSSLFARHYSGSRGFFPFLWVLRCFSSPACLYLPYVFRQEYARITTREFPHSEILGSKVGQHLPQAYRSRPRPSSALGAKASTVCSCSLDSERTRFRCRYGVFKVRARLTDVALREAPHARAEARAPSPSKLNSVRGVSDRDRTHRVKRGRRCSRRTRSSDGPGRSPDHQRVERPPE